MDDEVRRYVEGISHEFRPMFDRVDRLVREGFPGAVLGMAYGMPTYRLDRRRLHVGVWKHGLSLYGWSQDRAAELLVRHPHLRTSTGTVRLRPQEAQALSDDDLRHLVAAALGAAE